MKKEEIKNIMIVFSDNDFVRVWDWIGNILLYTLLNKNICNEEMLKDDESIKDFIFSILPTATEFSQYRAGTKEREIVSSQLDYLTRNFSQIRFKFNFTEEDQDWIYGGSETLIIDLEKKESFIR